MPAVQVWCLGTGMAPGLPGLKPDICSLAFPIWGDYILLDFAIAAFLPLPDAQMTVVHEPRHRQIVASALSRYSRTRIRTREIQYDIDTLTKTIPSRGSLVLTTLNSAFLADPKGLAQALEGKEPRRLTVAGSPLPVYVLAAQTCASILRNNHARLASHPHPAVALMDDVLPREIKGTVDIDGTRLFADNVMELWDANHLLRESVGKPEHAGYIGSFEPMAAGDTSASITSEGHVRNSIMGAGCRIEGYVEDSVIFPGVVVREQAEIRHSVIMSRNVIGPGAKVRNAVLMPASREIPGSGAHVGGGALVGGTGRATMLRNDDYPKQIKKGICLLGMDTVVPPKITIEAGCYIAPDISAGVLRTMKRVPKGASVS